MKRLHIVAIALIMLLLSGCFEINEEIDINPNGSGKLLVKTDMSQLIELMQSYGGKDDMEKQLPAKNIDTTIYMNSIADSAHNMSPETKALYKDGTLHVKMNIDEKLFKTDMQFPFANTSDLQKLYSSMNDKGGGMAAMFKSMAPKKDSSQPSGDNMPDMGQFNNIYDFQSHDGLISRKLNAAKWESLQQSQQFSQMKDAGSMGISIPYTITVNLPRPVKKVDNKLAVISLDKKQVVIKYNLVEVFQHPEQFEYTIVY